MLSNQREILTQAFAKAAEQALGQPFNGTVTLEKPKDASHGDVACNLAMQLAKPAKRNPRELAQALVDSVSAQLAGSGLVQAIDIAGPGFINVRLSSKAHGEVIAQVLAQGQQFGRKPASADKSVLIEFVSANPTGPLHVGHGRQAALGDALSAVMRAQGWNVHKEFYYNDAGVQIHTLAVSVQARAKGFKPGDAQWPESAYNGDYIADIAADFLAGKQVQAADGEPVQASGNADDLESIRQFAVAYLRAEQDLDLKAFGVQFDQFYLESSLYTEGKVEEAVNAMVASGKTFEEGGALWLRSTDYGDDKDRVMRKSDGGYTYFVPDVAYHISKFRRGFGKVINIQGTDHHGTIARVRAGLQASGFGIPQGYPDYVLHKMVTVMKGGQEVKISKRAGSYVTLRDLVCWSGGVDESQPILGQVEALTKGRDAVRFFLVSRKADTEFVFDVDLALSQSDENPVYYVQYAHARIHSILDQWGGNVVGLNGNTDLLTAPSELQLIRQLAAYGDVLAKSADELAPHHVAFYLRDLAGAFHTFYNAERVLVDDEALKQARLTLLLAVASVISNGLNVLGVSAPKRM
ncbi:arginine--tRNA ligase [Limnobacter litoralis]|uniref:Arginine--tRNA ligase n=1 Tax=Limnobacter litoralis TaxID=481366 RepID=A0ABQ5YSJ4_9BURK|nr:arginine--tRNA ligase [Limnobacter litoralis]GLR26851.1 arginine--tRNA ligase [Limnobacter litoralis]